MRSPTAIWSGRANSDIGSGTGRTIISVALHCAVLSLFLYKGRTHIAPMLLPGDSHGTQLTLTYLPGRAPQASKSPSPDARVSPAPTLKAKLADPKTVPPGPVVQPDTNADAKQLPAPSPNQTNSPASPNPDAASGADSLGTGNINIAYLDSFRSPQPDLSLLPRGVSGDVVLDVTIDTEGKIVALKKLSGVGYGIDENVIATVQAWVFHPATKDGTPVVSEQELHFHYEHSRNG
jgi:protein TonB